MFNRYSSQKNHIINTSSGSLCAWCPSHRLKERHTKIAKQHECSMKKSHSSEGRNLYKQTAGHVRDKELRSSRYCLELLFMKSRRKEEKIINRIDTRMFPILTDMVGFNIHSLCPCVSHDMSDMYSQLCISVRW